MRLIVRSVLVSVLVGVLGFAFGGVSLAALARTHGGEASPGDSLFSSPLVVSSVDRLLDGQESRAAREARRSDPHAVAERAAARWRFEDLTPSRAASEARAAFPDLIEHPAGGAPHLAAGQRIVRYPTDHAVQVSLPGGKGVIESLAPIASKAPHGGHVPFDLRMRQAGGHFEPVRSDVGVLVPRDLAKGISLSAVGVSLTPVDGHGSPLAASEGALAGSTVLWDASKDAAAGVRDLSTLAKALPEGFDLTTMLFSQRSPGALYFRVGAPAGAHLSKASDGSVRVSRGNATLAVVSPVSAEDAEGSPVPVAMGVRGDTIEVSVDLSGDYLYPIAVDPEVNDAQLAKTTAGKRSNWEFFTSNSSKFAGSAVYEGVGQEHLESKGTAEYSGTDWAYWGYQTKGNSKVYEIKTETSAKNKNAKIESFLEFLEPGGARETKKMLSNEFENPEYEKKAATLCAANASKVEECLPGSGKAKNAIHFQQSATGSPGSNYKFSDTMSQGIVSISEPAGTHSTTSFNTTSANFEFEAEIEGKKEKVKRANALYGSGSWLTKYGGALELVSKDPGIGVAATKLEYESSAGKWDQLSEHKYLENENACQGVQCYETHGEYWTLDPKLPDGEDNIRYKAEEAMSGTQSLESEGQATVKIDATAPRHVHIEGLPDGSELSEKPYELTGEATDGEGTTVASSGIKSIALFIDGHEFGTAAGSCSVAHGECTASAKWTVNGAELGAGHHSIEIVALDNAGNEARTYQPISIRHSTPVTLGPGSVDLQSGDFSLGANDVSRGSGLTVGRNYSSRGVLPGNNGPLGPQWSFSLTSTQSLVELIDGGVLMTDANGRRVIFAPLGEGKFESPTGDSNLELTLEENPTTKEKLAYYLKNPAAHTSLKFTQPAGTTSTWVPTKQEGTTANDTVTYSYQAAKFIEYPLPSGSRPQDIAAGPDGNLWFVEHDTNKIGKITPTGTLTEYSTNGTWTTLTEPSRITLGPDGNMWFLAEFNKGIAKITPSGSVTYMATVGGGVGTATDITSGPDGKLWFTESSSDKIGRYTIGGGYIEYSLPANSRPNQIVAGPDGNLWFTEYQSSKIGKITTSGAITEYALPAESKPVGIAAGPDGKLWFGNSQSNKIGKITTSGAITEYALPSGAEAGGPMVAGSDGSVWFTQGVKQKVTKITTTGKVTEYPLPSESYPTGLAAGPDGNIWFTGSITNKVGVVPIGGPIAEPTEELAPKPAGVSCEPELKAGCRALQFKYATTTTATSENQLGWGSYQTRLREVAMVAYNPSTKAMGEVWAAQYSYDSLGRLRKVADPRGLSTFYAYDAEGHVTAVTPPGQESWAFTYAPIAGDAGTGRLLKATRAPASAEVWIPGSLHEKLEATVSPKITGTAAVGIRLAVSSGTWSGSPVAYGYQWKQCEPSSGVCTLIPGATNPNYTPQSGDVGHTLKVTVTATNGGWTMTATPTTATVQTKETEYTVPGGSSPRGIVTGADGNLWYANSGTNKIAKTTPSGTITEYALPAGSSPKGMAAGPDGNLWFTDNGTNKIGKITTTGTITEYALPAGSGPEGIVAGPDGKLWYANASTNKIGKITTTGTITEYALPAGSQPSGITAGPDGKLWFTDHASSKIGTITTTGTITEYTPSVLGGPEGIAAGSDGNLWYTNEKFHKISKITTTGTVTQYTLPTGSVPRGITSGSDGNLWFTDYTPNKIGRITTSGAISEFTLSAASSLGDITMGPDGNLWYTEASDRIGKISGPGLVEGEVQPPAPGITLNYGVPLTGASAPYEMSKSEVAKWGQVDKPEEATAIFPPDEPQGWPASSYKRATVYYLDEQGRQVNVANPSTATYGSISTTEYNEFNDVIRTLSPNNRATALAAGASSIEQSKLLDTQSTYNGEGAKEGEVSEPGTRLIETLGPQHQIKYVAGKEQKESLARAHKVYVYDQGAPAGETYDLLTETYDLAQLVNHEEVEVRTTKTSYSGQSNLGWKLRAPTSVTVDPEGLKLTTTTEYNPTTGQVTETRGAGADKTLSYTTKFGELGTEAGKLKNPWGVAATSESKLWVVDTANNRVEKFGPEGAYVSKFGETGAGAGQLSEPKGIALDSAGHIWVADTGNNRIEEFSSSGTYMGVVGSLGSESGKFKAPTAVAFDTKGNLWVADTGNSRIEKFDSTGKYVSEFGSLGSEPGKLSEPKGIAVDASENVWVSDTGNNRIQEFSKTGSLLRRFGSLGAGSGQFNTPMGLGLDSSGNLWVIDALNGRAESFSTSGAYLTQIGWKGTEAGQLTEPRALTFDAAGKLWITDSSNNRLEQWSKGANAHDQKTIYYSAEANSEGYSACGSHPEWAGLVCETLPAKQPELLSLPKLPVTTYTYNMLNEPETVTETFGSTTRTNKMTYDGAGRRTSSETTASTGTSLPKVTFEYNKDMGLLEKQTTAGEGRVLKSEYNHLGQAIAYTDGDSNVAKYKYAGPENDFQLEEFSDSSNEGASHQTYSYDATTKKRTTLTDSAAGTFSASYDAEGNLAWVRYPYSKICAKYTRNSLGEATTLEYRKTLLCTPGEPALWYSDTRVPSIRGEMLSQTSTLGSETYAYDAVGRLTETQETPAGEGCSTRSYAYDEESNRASLTTRTPGGGGVCQSEGGTVEAHNYDEANRLADGGIAYDGLGNTTALPAADAEGHELTSSFYVDNAVASQTQNGVTNSYLLDPEGRVRETVTGSKKTISHYDGPGEGTAWSTEGAGKWTRNIPGIDGTLLATQTNGETPVLQLHDLQGNVVATIGDKAEETALLSTYNSTEFGVPNAGKTPPKFAWLGAAGVESALSSGVITYGSTSYVPQTGRALQSEPVEPPGLPGGSGSGDAYTVQEEPWNMQGAARAGAEAPGLEAARERAAAEAAIAAAIAAAGEGVDPVQWYTKYQAREVGKKFLEIATWAEVISVIGSIPSELRDVVEGALANAFSLDFALDWYHKAGQKLTQCGNEGKPWVSCKFVYSNWHLHISLPVVGTIVDLTLVNLFSGPETEKCTALPEVHCRRLNM